MRRPFFPGGCPRGSSLRKRASFPTSSVLIRAKTDMKANRLFYEKSPYLLQHAYNPVDWYPWGEDAFKKAREEDRPVFLSIGYSSCHWCHVMEKESFSDPGIAKVLNENFVAVKVDREERPDIDHVYLRAVTAMTGSAGWPLSVFLTPDLKPFFGGTYFPPEDRWGQTGFGGLLVMLSEMWKSDRAKVLESGESLTRRIRAQDEKKDRGRTTFSEKMLHSGFKKCVEIFDRSSGGFGDAPKFYQGQVLSFLLHYWARTGNGEALAMTEKTLQAVSWGGVQDHLGGGFHRYATDREWQVPHFEKMLYDQAILSRVYLEAYQATGNGFYRDVARRILEYVLRDMTSDLGIFHSAEDADSLVAPGVSRKRGEGVFYEWTLEEIESALSPDKAGIFCFHYDVRKEGNVPGTVRGECAGKNILHVGHSLEETAVRFQMTPGEAETALESCRAVLFLKRGKRSRPYRDEKVLTDWNGLMIESFALASRILGDSRYRRAAVGAADFLLARMKRRDGRLMHRWVDGEAGVPGFIEDYAFLSHALLMLYEATFDADYLTEAVLLAEEMLHLFRDPEGGGFFQTARDAESLIFRPQEIFDGAIPSGNSVAILVLLKLARLTMRKEFEAAAEKALQAIASKAAEFPLGFTQAFIAFDFLQGPSAEIVLAGEDESEMEEMLAVIYSRFLPNKILLFHGPHGSGRKTIEELSPFVRDCLPLADGAAAYVCRNYVCKLPVYEPSQLKTLLA